MNGVALGGALSFGGVSRAKGLFVSARRDPVSPRRVAALTAASSLNSGVVPCVCHWTGPLFEQRKDMRLKYRCHAKKAWLGRFL